MKLKDIAAMANVSPSTVSLVVKNKKGVSDEKRKLIEKLLKDYGYSVNETEEESPSFSEKKREICFIKYKRHGMLVDGNPGFVNSIIDAIETECGRQDCSLLMLSCNQTQLPSISKMVDNTHAEGILLLGTELSSEDAHWLSEISLPMVILDTSLPMTSYNCVTMNNKDAIFHSVEHLVSLGHTHIGFIANAYPSNNCLARQGAFQEAVEHYGLSFDPELIYPAFPTSEGAYQSMHSLLDEGTKFPSALIANNDCFALGAMKAFKEYGIRVPEDISIIGFDSIPFSSISEPPLTTMEVPCAEIGIWAVRLLCDRIRYPFSATTNMEISTKLIVRSSTAPFCKK